MAKKTKHKKKKQYCKKFIQDFKKHGSHKKILKNKKTEVLRGQCYILVPHTIHEHSLIPVG